MLLPDAHGDLTASSPHDETSVQPETAVARWVYDHQRLAGLNTDTLPGSKGLYLPLTAAHGVVGVLAVFPLDAKRFTASDQLHLLETFANQTALALERTRLALDAAHAQIKLETERTRNTLLSSVSHDLRTPLAVITGATSSLIQREATLTAADRRELAHVAFEESERLNRLSATYWT
ncbi:MAG: GAF domain-containing protein [Chloroflexi bacterium]|uniref:GAF domain-containing protein n=1 Tax=Candidatus Flexifilum breve TaxID=3140694 RepID=UPI0031351E4E|nr:GAF domain-containing protein [Chloroflexota bacterium]